MKLSNKFINSVLRQANPLLLPDAEGNGLVFKTMTDCYVYVMDMCYRIAPKGYVDLWLLYAELYNAKFSTATDYYKRYMKETFKKRFHIIELGDSASKMFFRKLLVCLHEGTNPAFELSPFESAFDIHLSHVRAHKLIVK